MRTLTLLIVLFIFTPAAFAQVPRGPIAPTPTTKQAIDRSLATDPEAWRDQNGQLPPPIALALGMNPADPAAARAYVLWIEAKTERTALAQLNVAVETHRRAIERLEQDHPTAIIDALTKAGLPSDKHQTPGAQFALQEAIATERTKLAEAETAFRARAATLAHETTGPRKP